MIRIGIIGCGRILAAHLRGYRLLREAGINDFRITALCARRIEDAHSYLRRGQGPAQRLPVSSIAGDPLSVGDEYLSDFQDDAEVAVYDDYRRMIAEGPVDAINDFSPHGLHHLVADAACRHGKDLLTQKPLAVTVAAARGMCDAFDAAGRILGVFENARYRPRTRFARWLFDSGRLGQLQMIVFGSAALSWAPNRIVAGTPWRHRKDMAGGITLDIAVHQFDVFRHIAGEIDTIQGTVRTMEPVRVALDEHGKEIARIDCDADDTYYVSFVTRSGAVGIVFSSWAGHGEPTVIQPGPVYYGSRGSLAGTRVTFDDGQVADAGDLYWKECAEARRNAEFPRGITDEFALNQLDWLSAIREGRAPETSGREGLADLACAFSVLESHKAHRSVSVEDVLSGRIADYQRDIARCFGLP